MACNRRIVRRLWLRAALLFRRCVNANCATIDSARLREQRPPQNQRGQSLAAAVRTWQSVSPGFFPPMLHAEFAEKHMAEAAENQMPLDRAEFTHLKMVHPKLGFAVFEGPLDDPPRKGYPQKYLGRGSRRRITDKVFDLRVVQRIARRQQMIRPRRQTVLIGQIDRHMFDLPDHRPFTAILDIVILPLKASHRRGITQDISQLHAGIVLDLQTGIFLPSARSFVPVVSAVKNLRASSPGHNIHRNLSNVVLPQMVQFPQETLISAISFIKGQPSETQTVAHSPMVLLQGDLPLGAIDDTVANTGLAAPLSVLMPRLIWQKHLSVQQGVEIRRGVTEVNANNAVFEFAHRPAVLTLDTGGLVAFLGKTGLIDHADAVWVRMTPGNVLLQAVAQGLVIPAKQAEELLKIPWRLADGVGHWFDTLSGQIAQLPLDIEVEIPASGDSAETVIELPKEPSKFRFDSHNCFDVHADNLLKNHCLQKCHRLAA